MNITDYEDALRAGLKLYNHKYINRDQLKRLARDAADAASQLYVHEHWRDQCVCTGELAKQVLRLL